MGLIDSHAHLTDASLFDQVDSVLQCCDNEGVERIICVGTDVQDARRVIGLTQRYPDRISACIGFHPHEADKVGDEDFEQLWRLLDEPSVVAFGEMGLDYHYDFADRSRQKEVFVRQLGMAVGKDLPVVIHSREAFDDTTELLLSHGMKDRRVVFHCFTGTPGQAQRLAENGWRISFTGVVTFKSSAKLQGIARDYPMDKLMVETDSPYLSPVPIRGKRPNEPSHVVHVARFLAELRGVSYQTLAEQTRRNTIDFFALPR